MKVKELIKLLQKEDPDKRLVTAGYEGGYDELEELQYVCITPNQNKLKEPDKLWYLGEFKECIKNTDKQEIAILLPRKS